MKSLRYALVAAVAAIVLAGPAFAQGNFPTLPIVGGASYCSSYSTGTSGQVCTSTVPAGPTVETGNELVPADTRLSSGRSPQSVLMPARLFSGAVQYTVPTDGSSTTVTAGVTRVVLIPAGTLTTATVVFPASTTTLYDGQTLELSSTATITGLTITAGSGTSVSTPSPTALTVSTTASYGYKWIYRASNTTWYRLQ